VATPERIARRRGLQRARTRARRALLLDLLAAIVIALLVLKLAAGLGVIGFFALPLLVLGLLWIGGERLLGGARSKSTRPSFQAGPHSRFRK
jgi:hypothetical protein